MCARNTHRLDRARARRQSSPAVQAYSPVMVSAVVTAMSALMVAVEAVVLALL
jgi:hypothetical protein